MNVRIGLVAIALALAGCAQPVAQMGPDTYTVTAPSGYRSRAVQRAGDYCHKIGREVLVTDIADIFGTGTVDVTFRCVDPAARRPYERGPDVIIQNRQ